MPELIARSAQSQILAELDNNKILLIVGPRQSGKTTLLAQVADKLRLEKQQVHYYNFDRTADLDFFNSQQKIEAFLRIRSIKSRLYIFIDEVQRKQDVGNFFKFFYDAGLNVKFIFSGSSSLELTESFGDALTGRKRIIQLLPLSVHEIAASQLGEEYQFLEMGEPLALEKFTEIIDQATIWGSYPEVVQKGDSRKLKALGELYDSYVQKDVKDLLRVKNISGFNMLVKLIAHSVGKPLVVEDLVRQTGLHAATVNSYLDILEGTMIIARSENYNPLFADNLPKSRRYYFLDNGFRNYSLGQLQSGYRVDLGELAANLIYTEIAKLPRSLEVNHYQTYSDNHVDFIVREKQSSDFLPIVVRYPDNKNLGKGIHEFLASHSPKKLYIVGQKLQETVEVKGTQVIFMPLAQFLAQLPNMTEESS